MKIENVKVHLDLRGGCYSPHMGHASVLTVDGEDALDDDGERLTVVRLPQKGETVVSETAASTIKMVVDEVDGTTCRGIGTGEGAERSLTWGTACHGNWRLECLPETRVAGTYGEFKGRKALERYSAAKAADRGRFFRLESDGSVMTDVVGLPVPNELGDVYIANYLDREPWQGGALYPQEIRHTADFVLRRLLACRRWEAFKASYRGTRLYRAARKAGFGEFVPAT
jgi:hypothetical protein